MPRKKTSPKSPAESSGVVEAVKGPSETAAAETTPDLPTPTESELSNLTPVSDSSLSSRPEPDAPVMERLKQKAREEAQEGRGATKGPHPYEYTINAPGNVPEAYRDGNYDIDTALIDDHLQRCHDIGTTPQIPGLLIGRKA
jgi:hypothetical protein